MTTTISWPTKAASSTADGIADHEVLELLYSDKARSAVVIKELISPFYWGALSDDYNLTSVDFYEIGNKGCETMTAAIILDLMDYDEEISPSFKLDSYVVNNKDSVFIYVQDESDCYCIEIPKTGSVKFIVLEHCSNDILKDLITSTSNDYYLNDAELLMDCPPFLYMKYAW